MGGEDGGSERARGPEEINKSDGRTSGATGAAGVSTADPDGGAGILEDEQRDGALSRSRWQSFSNDWLMHPEMMVARVKLTKCMEQMRVNQMWTHELDQIWQNLCGLQEAKPAMSEMLQLNEQRRRAYVSGAPNWMPFKEN